MNTTEFPEAGYDPTAGSDEYDTPIDLFAPIARAVNGFDLDPCASATSDLADTNWTADDGGLRPWFGKVYMNPPYSDIGTWMEHAATQARHEQQTLVPTADVDLIVGLVFARTSTEWFHRWATTADWLCFIEGRIQFVGMDDTAPSPSLMPVWGDVPDALLRTLGDLGWLVDPAQNPQDVGLNTFEHADDVT